MSGREEDPTAGFEQRYHALLDVSRALAAVVHPQDLYPTIYEQTSRVLDASEFQIALYDPATDEVSVVFRAVRTDPAEALIRYPASTLEALRRGRALIEEPAAGGAPAPAGAAREEDAARSRISAPLVRHGRILGVMSAESYRQGAYDASHLELLTAIADLAAVALDNVRHLTEAERRRREAERLEEIGRALVGSLELNDVLQRIAGAALDLASADSASVWLLTGEDSAQIAMTAGEHALERGTTVSFPRQLREKMVERRESLVVSDVQAEPLLPAELKALLPTQCGMAVPLVGGDRVIGALAVGHSRSREYRSEDVRLLERLGYQAAVAVENARLHQRIRNLSLTDPLTTLPNRRRLQLVLDQEFAAARRGRPLAVVLFDLDNFKQYNDAAGHHAGDEVLRAFAAILSSQTRAMNLVARFGGDEFVAVLSDATYRGALRFARRIERLVREDEFLARLGITVSSGIAVYLPEMTASADLLRAADRDLYNRKHQRKGNEARTI